MDPEVIAIAITSGLAAFTGVIKSLNGFNENLCVLDAPAAGASAVRCPLSVVCHPLGAPLPQK